MWFQSSRFEILPPRLFMHEEPFSSMGTWIYRGWVCLLKQPDFRPANPKCIFATEDLRLGPLGLGQSLGAPPSKSELWRDPSPYAQPYPVCPHRLAISHRMSIANVQAKWQRLIPACLTISCGTYAEQSLASRALRIEQQNIQ